MWGGPHSCRVPAPLEEAGGAAAAGLAWGNVDSAFLVSPASCLGLIFTYLHASADSARWEQPGSPKKLNVFKTPSNRE